MEHIKSSHARLGLSYIYANPYHDCGYGEVNVRKDGTQDQAITTYSGAEAPTRTLGYNMAQKQASKQMNSTLHADAALGNYTRADLVQQAAAQMQLRRRKTASCCTLLKYQKNR